MKNFRTYSLDQSFGAAALYYLLKHECPNSNYITDFTSVNGVRDPAQIRDIIADAISRKQNLSLQQPFAIVFTIDAPLLHGANFSHSVTACIDPVNKTIEVNDPLPVVFPQEVVQGLQRYFPGYTITENPAKLQEFHEKSCQYISAKKVIAFLNGLPFPSKQSIINDLGRDSEIIANAMHQGRQRDLDQDLLKDVAKLRNILLFARLVLVDLGADIESPDFKPCVDEIMAFVKQHYINQCGSDNHRAIHDAFEDEMYEFNCSNGGKVRNQRYDEYRAEVAEHFAPLFRNRQLNIAAAPSGNQAENSHNAETTVVENPLIVLLGDGSHGDKAQKKKNDPQRKKLTSASISNALSTVNDKNEQLSLLEDAFQKIISKPTAGESYGYAKRSKCHALFFLRLRKDEVRLTGLQQKHIKLLKKAYIDIVKGATTQEKQQLIETAKQSGLIKANRTNYQIAMRDEVKSYQTILALA